MRSLMFLPVLVLFCSLQDTSCATNAIISANSVCCEGFTNINIPLRKIVSYQWTTSTCATKAIVFNTIAGKAICVDPDNTLVSGQVAKLDKKTSSALSTSATTKAPASTSATTSSPESTSATTSSPASTSATTSSPATTSATTSSPASTSATTSSPESTSAKASSPASTSATSSPPSTSSTTETFTTAEFHRTTL
ncbi:uncharacterized protein LOC130219555 [Danio aesculapii]|uniref:uncharacterized protein LOC130219555 n=1 Tax=Danio aesculapii TaxID=1142201 RepID=UPI0024BF3A2F|nr:uncharacterized protein LOC130219555 [Danio aesculapii]